MPETRRTALPAKPSRSVLITGIPPPTAASNASARAVGFGEPREFDAVGRDHRLVGGDQGHTARQGRLRRLVGRALGAADQLDEDVDVPLAASDRAIVVESRAREIDAAIALGCAR